MAIFGYLTVWVRQSWPSGAFLTAGPILDFILFKLALADEANQLSILSTGHSDWGRVYLEEQGAQWASRLKLAITKAPNQFFSCHFGPGVQGETPCADQIYK